MRTLAACTLLAAAAAADLVVLEDRTILEGAATRKDSALSIAGRTVPLDEVLLWEDAEGGLLHAPDFGSQIQALSALRDRGRLAAARDAFAKAAAAGDPKAAAEALERAAEAGLDPKEAGDWSAKLDRLVASGAFPLPPEPGLEEILVDRARKAKARKEEDRAAQLLRAALLRAPAHEEGLKLLAEMAPPRWRAGDARNWLDWRVDVLRGGVRVLRYDQPDLERAAQFWKSGLSGIETPEVVFLTDLADGGPVGKCLRLAGVTCRALETIFRTDTPAREEYDPLVIYFYGDKKEYEQRSGAGTHGPGGPVTAGLTLGHYNPADNISRFFWFDRPDAEKVVTETFVHELTHHWIERRCPRFHFRDMGKNPMVPGYWIVEGFAVFMQEGRYDPERGAWTHWNAKSPTLDVIAGLAKEQKLLPWEKVYPLSQAAFSQLGMAFNVRVPRRWSLQVAGFSETNLFYYQAGATCQFLYHGDNGAWRQRLVEYVTNYYMGKQEFTSTESAFGLSPDELGRKVVAFAQSVQAGWRPGAAK